MHLLSLDKSETMAEKEEEEKTAVVTGSASGIGFETSLLLAKNGFRTYATVRDLDKAKPIKEISDKRELPITVVELDVTSDKSVSDAIDKIINKESKRIDVQLIMLVMDRAELWKTTRWMKLRHCLRPTCLVP